MPIADHLSRRAAVLLVSAAVLAACAPAVEPEPSRPPAPAVESDSPRPPAPAVEPDHSRTTPTLSRPVPPEQAWAAGKLAGMTLEQKVGQLFVDVPFGTSADVADRRNKRYGVATPAELVARYHLGGVIYFDWSNGLRSPAQITRLSNGLQASALRPGPGVPLIICTDQESGMVNRIGPPFTDLPGASELGLTRSAEDAMAAARIAGTELRAMGINTDLAPVADVNVNPANPVIGPRSFSADPALAAMLTSAQVTGYQESVAAAAKHFPGHGDTVVDSHTDLPVITHDGEQWNRLDAPPFRSAIAAGVDVIMTGHLSFPLLDPSGDPATLSQPIITGLLRGELGFRGVVITDSLRMRGVRARHPDDRIPVLALKAGVDVLLMPPDLNLAYRSVLAAVRSGELTERRIDKSVTRILELKFRRGIAAQPLGDEATAEAVVGSAAHREIASRLAAHVASAAQGGG
jgi:beta-N-acetylhexosaminidase